MVFNFDTEIFRVLQKFPFYGAITQQMERVIDRRCPSAGIAFKKNKYYLYVNPDFMDELTDNDKTSVLIHEILHVILGHAWRCDHIQVPHKVKNLAADLVVNQHLKFEKDFGAVTLDKFNFPPNQTVHEYINLLKDLQEEMQQQGGEGEGGEGEGDPQDGEGQAGEGEEGGTPQDRNENNSHEWVQEQNEGSTTMKEVIGKNMIERAIKTCGKVPGEIEAAINDILMKGKIPWTQIVRRYVDNSRKFYLEPNRFKANRRQPNNMLMHGNKRIDLSKLIVAIDTSGSVSDSEIEYFLAEIIKIAATKTEITVIECDSQIQKVYKPQNQHKIQTNVKGRGGTEFDPVFQYALENRFKYVIYFTDLECRDPLDKYQHIRTLWVTQKEEHKRPVKFGKVISID